MKEQALPRENTTAVVKLEKITKRFEGEDFQVTAIENVSLEIQQGDFVVFVGPSGSGKSTLLNIIAGLERASEGNVFINGIKLAEMSDRALSRWRAKHVGIAFQSHNLIPVLNSYQNVELPLLLNNLPKKERKQHVLEALRQVGLSDRVFHFPKQLSGGEEQRVAIARAMIHNPDFIVLDEPTGNLDRKAADDILSLFKELNEKYNKTILMVTHDLKATTHANRIVELDKGVVK